MIRFEEKAENMKNEIFLIILEEEKIRNGKKQLYFQ